MGKKKTTKQLNNTSSQVQTNPANQITIDRVSLIKKLAQQIVDFNNTFSKNFKGFAGLSNAYRMANIQNERIKAIDPLPQEIDKKKYNDAILSPQNNEDTLSTITSSLVWTTYPFYKIIKSYADMMTFNHYEVPLYVDKEDIQSKKFLKEWQFVDKALKKLDIRTLGHKIAMQVGMYGKVFYTLRCRFNKKENTIDYCFLQRLPQEYCKIVGQNDLTGWTIAFNMMYFSKPGTDINQFGDLFLPYELEFRKTFEPPKDSEYQFYAESGERVNNAKSKVYINNYNKDSIGNPQAYIDKGNYYYWVYLPIDRVFTFEIDNSTAIVSSPFISLASTLIQQSSFEATQFQLVLQPLMQLFTAEIPFLDNAVNGAGNLAVSVEEINYFYEVFKAMMNANNTQGTDFFAAPYKSIQSHNYSTLQTANEVASSYSKYAYGKAGLSSIISSDESPQQGMAEFSAKLEGKFTDCIYSGFRRMIKVLFDEIFKLKYDWKIEIFGDVYSNQQRRADAEKALLNGDTTANYILSALENNSILDKIAMARSLDGMGYLDLLRPPITAYTQSNSSGEKQSEEQKNTDSSKQSGSPTLEEREIKQGTGGIKNE